MPATMPSTAKPVVTVEESLMLSNGKSPVRINHSPSKIIPRFLPAKLFVSAIPSPFLIGSKFYSKCRPLALDLTRFARALSENGVKPPQTKAVTGHRTPKTSRSPKSI